MMIDKCDCVSVILFSVHVMNQCKLSGLWFLYFVINLSSPAAVSVMFLIIDIFLFLKLDVGKG